MICTHLYIYVHGTDGEADYSEHEVRISFNFQAGIAGQISGPPEDCYPAEGPEIEVSKIEVNWSQNDWHPASKDLAQAIDDEVGKFADLWDEMCATAEDELQAQHDDYMEAKAEARAEARYGDE